MVFANINNRLNILEDKLNNMGSVSSNPQAVSNESYDNKLAELESRLSAVEESVAKVSNIEQILGVSTEKVNQMAVVLASLNDQLLAVNGRIDEISEIMQNA